MTVGEKLLNLRKSKNLSQEEVANKLNVSRQTISKWETDQSTPDFDKIIPICKLYGITSNELLSDDIKEVKVENKPYNKNKSAKLISAAVFLYILSVVMVIFFSAAINAPIIGVCLFFISIAAATGLIIYNAISNPKGKRELSVNEKKAKQLDDILSIFILIIYFIVSFATMAWHITWLIFLIGALLGEVIKLVYSLKEDNNE